MCLCHPPLPHHAGRGVAVGVNMDDGQGAVGGGAGPEDGVGDQVVTPQAHRHTPVREDGPDMNIQMEWGKVWIQSYLYCSVMLSHAAFTL